MTIRDIGIMLGFDVDHASEARVENSITDLKSMATRALGAIGVTLSVAGITSAIKDCVSVSSEVEEMENKFNVVFGNIREDVDAWAQEYSNAIGRNKNDIKGYLADQQNLLVGFGMTRKEGAELSKQMTTLALDLSSFANIDETMAVENMTKAVMGETEAARVLGAVLNDTTRDQAMMEMGLSGTFESLDQLTKMQVNYHAILSQSPDAVGDCERSVNSYRAAVIRFQSKLKEIKTLIGQFFMPTFQKVVNFGARGLTVLRDFLQRTEELTDKLGGSTKVLQILLPALAATFAVMNIGKITSAVKGFLRLAGAMGLGAKKAALLFAAFVVAALVVQDFIAFMKGENSLLGSLFDKAGINAEEVRDIIKSVWTEVSAVLADVWATIKDAAVTIFDALKLFWDHWGDTILAVFGHIIATLIRLIKPFMDALGALIEFLANVFTGNWAGAWEAIKNFTGAIWDGIVTILKGAWDIITTIWSGLKENFGAIFQTAWETIKEKVSGIRDTIVDGFNAAIEWIKSLPAEAVTWGADIIRSIVDGIMGGITWVKDAVSNVAQSIRDFIGFSEPESGPLSDFHTYMPDMMDLMRKGILDGKKKVMEAFGGVAGEMSLLASANVVSDNTTSRATGNSGNSRVITQNVSINNQFNGDRAGQVKSSVAMKKATDDSTSRMARALALT